MPRLSVLDLSPIIEGGDAALAFRNTADLAQHAEKWGYHRFWLAEHHNLPGIASAATSVVIGHVAGKTKSIRVGAGGIMLPNHAPLVIAEQFGTLESLYPGPNRSRPRPRAGERSTHRPRVAPLSRQQRRHFPAGRSRAAILLSARERRPGGPGGSRRGLNVPLYLLGSSDFSARLAAELGLPFAFASHFAPEYLEVALDLYRREFQPSAALERPYVIIGAGVFAAETDAEARRLFSSAQLMFLSLIRGRPGKLPPPVDRIEDYCSPAELAAIAQRTRCSAVGSPETVGRRLLELLEQTQADEIIATAQIYDHTARLRSFEIASEVFRQIGGSPRK